MEHWKGLMYNGVDYSKYLEVSDRGYIRRVGKIHPLKPFMKENGYLVICATLGSRSNKRHFSLHRAVAETFIVNDDPINKNEVNHIDGCKINNTSSNLEWCDKSYNMRHAIQNRLATIPSKRYSALTDQEKEFIRAVCKPGDRKYGLTALSRRFGVSRTAISNSLHTNGVTTLR